MSSVEMPWRAEMLLQRKAIRRRVAHPELELGRRRDGTVGEIAARLGAMARGQRVGEELGRQFHHVVQGAAVLLVARRIGRRGRQRNARHRGKTLHRLGKRHALGLHQEVEDVAVQPGREVEPGLLLIIDEERGRLLLLERRQPLPLRPAFLSLTRRPTTSETGSRARSSSRNSGVKRIWLQSGIDRRSA